MVRLHLAKSNKRMDAAPAKEESNEHDPTTAAAATSCRRPRQRASKEPLPRSDTVLEMTRWKEEEEEESNLVEIAVGQDNDEAVVLVESSLLVKDESFNGRNRAKPKTVESPVRVVDNVDAYMARREMTKRQERWNALTMIPSPLYCIYYILAGKWLTNSSAMAMMTSNTQFHELTDEQSFLSSSCIQNAWLPQLHAMPPLTVLFVGLGIALHAPFSFVYHWKYAHALPPGIARTDHVSRRLDQAMIHVASALVAYSTSASWQYFIANLLYNCDCWRRHLFQKEIYPKRNQIRIAISMLFYTIPILLRDIALFCECWAIILVSVWLFVRYPFGGWSHSAFHLVIALLPPLLMEAACEISTSDIAQAAACAAVKNQHTGSLVA